MGGMFTPTCLAEALLRQNSHLCYFPDHVDQTMLINLIALTPCGKRRLPLFILE